MSIKLNLSLNLPDEVRMESIALSQELAQRYDARVVLGESENYPHITVYAVEFPDDAVQRVLDEAQRITVETEPIACTVKQIEAHQGYIGIELIKSPAIMHFHDHVVDILAPLRAQRHGGGVDYGMSFTDEQITNMEQYGYPDALRLYNPHFTITRLRDESRAQEAVTRLKWEIVEFTVRSIGIYTMSDHGTCKKLPREFMLG